MNDATWFKIIAAVSIWIIGFGGGILPIFLKGDKILMGYMNCFSAGVFLAGGFMHLLHGAVVNDGLRKWSTDKTEPFPYAEMFCTIGFLTVFFVEQAAHKLYRGDIFTAKLSDDDIESISPFVEQPRVESDDVRNHEHIHSHLPPDNGGSPAVAFVLFLALSFHSVMEGLGLGAQTDSAWGIFFAIILHKGLAAFALGSNLLRNQIKKQKFAWYMLLFSLMSILGIIIGWIIVADDTSDSAASGICIALASGTFIYVATMEVIPQEFSSHQSSMGKCIALLIGYSVFGLLAKWV